MNILVGIILGVLLMGSTFGFVLLCTFLYAWAKGEITIEYKKRKKGKTDER